jgi:hypothetical protein
VISSGAGAFWKGANVPEKVPRIRHLEYRERSLTKDVTVACSVPSSSSHCDRTAWDAVSDTL